MPLVVALRAFTADGNCVLFIFQARVPLRSDTRGFHAARREWIRQVQSSSVYRYRVNATHKVVRMHLARTFQHGIGVFQTAQQKRIIVEVQGTVIY